MKTKTEPATGTTKKIRPITVTIDGELAATIREGAKQMGFRPATWARQCMATGDLLSSHTDEAKEFRRDFAMSEVGISGKLVGQIEHAAKETGKSPEEFAVWIEHVLVYMLHQGDKLHLTMSREQLDVWFAASKKSQFGTLREWIAATLDAQAAEA